MTYLLQTHTGNLIMTGNAHQPGTTAVVRKHVMEISKDKNKAIETYQFNEAKLPKTNYGNWRWVSLYIATQLILNHNACSHI